MKKSNFFKKINKIEKIWEDYTYAKCKTVQDKLNWKTYHTEVMEGVRVFFFSKTNTVVLIDKSNGYKKHFRNPSKAIKEIDSFLIALMDN